MQLKKNKNGSKLSLPPVLDAYQAPDLKAKLLDALDHNQPLAVDASAIEQLDTSCCQLLVAAKRAFNDAELAFSLTDQSTAAHTSLSRLGLYEPLTTTGTTEDE